VSETWSRKGAEQWAEGGPVEGTLGETYVRGRQVGGPLPGPDVLRFHPAVEHPNPKLKQKFPALIAKVSGASEPSYNFTYLAADGSGKAKIDKKDQRRTLGSNKGGVVQLAPAVDGRPVVITEGIETGLTVMEATGLPVWASLGTSGLKNFEWLGDGEIILAAENDDNDANQKALAKICPILIEKGFKVRVAWPPTGCKDFNDVVQKSGRSGLAIVKLAIDAAPEWKPKRGKAKADTPPKTSQASCLVDLAVSRCELFCDAAGEDYASFTAEHASGEHRETHRIRSKSFNRWLRLRYYAERNGAPSSEAMASTVKTLMAKAHFDGDRREVYLRSASLDGRIYLDMCNPAWQAVEIDADGFRIVDDPPVHFRRSPGMLPLPTPSKIEPKEGIERLSEVLRLRDPRDFVVIAAWLLAALAGRAPYAIIIFLGEPGATKTSAAYAVRSIIDPNASPLRAKPKEPHDVFVAATHSLIVGYNNLSTMPDWLSDTICVVSEGSGESRRELFTDADESLIVACAPFLLTGIENVIKRGDLAQRTLYVHLVSVPDKERLTEQEFKARFRRVHADLLGALCGAASVGLQREKTLKLDSLPRLATFFHWGSACEEAFWQPGEFSRAFAANAEDATEDVIEAEPAAAVFQRFMLERGEWQGTATELLSELVTYVRRPVREAETAHARATQEEKEYKAARLREARDIARDILGDRWPKAPNALSGRLKRASPALRNVGVRIEWPTRHGEARIIKAVMTMSKSKGQRPSQLSERPAQSGDRNDFNGLKQESAGEPASSGDRPGDDLDEDGLGEGGLDGDGLDEGGTRAGRSSLEVRPLDKSLNPNNNLTSKVGRNGRDGVSRPISDIGDDGDDDGGSEPPVRVRI
jgi:hypothetical protein